ncbi:predicted protein [Histoplasma capsulatum G186AR]|uniref:Uncharacterized protein n=1 Tax=Ajellomyces capsulatus (strain G186AR / H82 / ATCC MYA-2454 / RMSCC 2432) TaxID=447093 RepID=C0NDC9_AJECG|nr:uncharacterized protein HCBG_01125 [Histoplasma capsulatum G186AR]EEH11670.1 predicted protein [Histoplasma capsulatum G186AR]
MPPRRPKRNKTTTTTTQHPHDNSNNTKTAYRSTLFSPFRRKHATQAKNDGGRDGSTIPHPEPKRAPQTTFKPTNPCPGLARDLAVGCTGPWGVLLYCYPSRSTVPSSAESLAHREFVDPGARGLVWGHGATGPGTHGLATDGRSGVQPAWNRGSCSPGGPLESLPRIGHCTHSLANSHMFYLGTSCTSGASCTSRNGPDVVPTVVNRSVICAKVHLTKRTSHYYC